MLSPEIKYNLLSKVQEKCQENNLELLYCTIVGSHAYGNDTEDSDADIRFVFAAPENFYLGFGGKDTLTIDTEDTFGYELRKWILLLAENNPTVLEMLFMENDSILFMHDSVKRLFSAKQKFLSKRCQYSYLKYAESQIYKAKSCTKEVVDRLELYEELLTHNKIDLQNLSVKQVVRDKLVDYPAHFTISQCLGVSIGTVIDGYKKFKQEKFPYSDLGNKRRKLLKLFGYDTKNCSHAIRLARTCKDIFLKEELKVRRDDAKDFLEIKLGKYSLQELEQEFIILKGLIENLLVKHSSLPEEVDRKMAEDLCITILKEVLFR